MLIFNFENAILEAIKLTINEHLPSIANEIQYFNYEPAGNETNSLPEEERDDGGRGYAGALAVYVRKSEQEKGEEYGNWNFDNTFEIDCYGFSSAEYIEVAGERVKTSSSKLANLISKAILSAAYRTVTAQETLDTSFGAEDGEGNKIITLGKKPIKVETFTQESFQDTARAECIRKLYLMINIEEPSETVDLGPLLAGFNFDIAAFNKNQIE